MNRASSRNTVADIIGKRLSEKPVKEEEEEQEDADESSKLYHMGLAAKEAATIHRGRFSWLFAALMCFFIVGAFVSLVLMLLSLRNDTFRMISEEVSYINAPNPPWEMPPWGSFTASLERALSLSGLGGVRFR
ncbi:unnamed protein product [Symbiodinium necroappetens]|uniref:Uncharacterized protein n=1 Tax=Symbiodinium necroappetens TaxID=1628268 RepID=A0A813A039_9DINO|nr:unnamed protein product [Symbiodinium necroappetens]